MSYLLVHEFPSSEQVIEQGQAKWGGGPALCIIPCINCAATQFCEHWRLISHLVLCVPGLDLKKVQTLTQNSLWPQYSKALFSLLPFLSVWHLFSLGSLIFSTVELQAADFGSYGAITDFILVPISTNFLVFLCSCYLVTSHQFDWNWAMVQKIITHTDLYALLCLRNAI